MHKSNIDTPYYEHLRSLDGERLYKQLNALSSARRLEAELAAETYAVYIVTVSVPADVDRLKEIDSRHKYSIGDMYAVQVQFDHDRDCNCATVFTYAEYTLELSNLLAGVLKAGSGPAVVTEIEGKKYRRLTEAEFKLFTGYNDYTIKHPEVRPRKFCYTIENVTETKRKFCDWRGRPLLKVEEVQMPAFEPFLASGLLRDMIDTRVKPTAVWYPDGKIFYFDDCVYEPLEAERGV